MCLKKEITVNKKTKYIIGFKEFQQFRWLENFMVMQKYRDVILQCSWNHEKCFRDQR